MEPLHYQSFSPVDNDDGPKVEIDSAYNDNGEVVEFSVISIHSMETSSLREIVMVPICDPLTRNNEKFSGESTHDRLWWVGKYINKFYTADVTSIPARKPWQEIIFSAILSFLGILAISATQEFWFGNITKYGEHFYILTGAFAANAGGRMFLNKVESFSFIFTSSGF